MGLVFNLILIFIVVILETTVMNFLAIKMAVPNLILIIMLGLLFLGYKRTSLIWALVGGLCLDLLSGLALGSYTLALLFIYSLISFSQRIFEVNEFYILILTVFLSSLFLNFFLIGYQIIWGTKINLIPHLTTIFFESIYNVGLTLLIYPLLVFIDQKINLFFKTKPEIKMGG